MGRINFMNFYIEVTLLPGADIDLYYLWSKVYQQIHLAFVENQDNNGKVLVGIAFPEYNEEKYQLGSKIRLFAQNESVLGKLDIMKWLKHLSDYVHCTRIRPVPDKIKQLVMYSRKQGNRSQSKLNRTIKRKAEREGISIEKASL
ncbi:MAG: type I-F CRISPR-associated endoribonuclease Cas6/Csy4, partial [Candidatus Cloacimonadota bacterium]|nr:type I-F CRISPR-associated endoribonuclease Cas6/Csy4 [Candidatus Cloacimonadota bacterium]